MKPTFATAFFLHLLVIGIDSASPDLCSESEAISDDACAIRKIKTTKIRIVYLDKQYNTQNQPAMDAATSRGMPYAFGQTCDSSSTAIPEWFVVV